MNRLCKYFCFFLLFSCKTKKASYDIHETGPMLRYLPYEFKLSTNETIFIENRGNVSIDTLSSNLENYTLRLNSITGDNLKIRISNTVTGQNHYIESYLVNPPVTMYYDSGDKLYFSGDTIPKNILLSKGGVSCATMNLDLDIRYLVVTKTTILVNKNKSMVFSSEGNGFSVTALESIEELSGDFLLLIKDIEIKGLSQKRELLHPFVLFVSE